jgi:hypothetical protein
MSLVALAADAKEVRVLRFAFSVPDSWHVEGRGGERLFATGASKSLGPPTVMAEACVPSPKRKCDRSQLSNWPSCAEASLQFTPREGNLTETRYLCPAKIVEGQSMLAGTTLFEVEGAMLVVSYIAGSGDTDPSSFLSDLRQSLKFVQS